MRVIIQSDYQEMSKYAAHMIAEQIKRKPQSVLGLATGSTPLGLYKELIRLYENEGLDFSKCTTFNLDEYLGLTPQHPQSYDSFMKENFFNHINIDPRFSFIPNGQLDPLNLQGIKIYCEWYENEIQKEGGLDVQILGIGANGHIGFNEPGSSFGSRTRIKTLTEKTRQDNARFFDNNIDHVPKYAVTMGIATIMDARQLILLASGNNKALAVKKAIEGPISAMVPASIVQMHPQAILIIDKEAASELEYDW
ncbi:glucosamine-6-phosphate deaminase [candidate division KSB1 bacterium]|nr:glucosamine-6-phosphate deaminase [candidate division KSB1 bacterium]